MRCGPLHPLLDAHGRKDVSRGAVATNAAFIIATLETSSVGDFVDSRD